MRSKLTFLAFLLFALMLRGAETPKPNILFILADDLGYGDLSINGNPVLKTPNIDLLTSKGTDFQQVNVLNLRCPPSRATATTCMYPARFCIHQHFAPGTNVEHIDYESLKPAKHRCSFCNR